MGPFDLLLLWRERAQKSSEVHYKVASATMRWNARLSIAVVVVSAFVGSAMFATLNETIPEQLRWVLALASVAAAVLAGLQRVLALGEQGEKHRWAGSKWDEIFNRICILLTQYDSVNAPPKDVLDSLEKQMSDLVAKSPFIPQRWFEKVSLVKTYARLSGAPD